MFRKLVVSAAIAPTMLIGLIAVASTSTAQALPAISAMSIHESGTNLHAASTPLTYNGGQVETAPAVYIDFWGSAWNSGASVGTDGSFTYTYAQAVTYVEDFYNNVGGSAWDGVNSQYCQGVATGTINCGSSGTHIANLTSQLKGVMVDSTNSIPGRVTQTSIANEAAYAAGKFGLGKQSQAGATVFVFTPSGHSMRGFGTQWCAWHSLTSYSGGNLPYAYMPFQTDAGASCGENFVNKTPNAFGNGFFDGFSVVGGHEYSEAETDAFPTTGLYGWIDSSGSEIGDKCAWNAASSDITLGGNSFAVQPLWSNSASGCALS